MLYHQRYSTDFQKLSFCWKTWKVGIWEENLMSAAILVLQLQGENFFQVEKFEISHFQAVHCVIKNAISPKVFNRFSKTFLLLKDLGNRYLGRKFHERSYFSFAIVSWKLFSSRKIWNFPLSSCTPCQQKRLYHQRYSTDFEKLSFCWKMWKIGIWAEKIMSAAILVLQWQGENY